MFSKQIEVDLEKIKSLFTYERISSIQEINDDDFTFYSRTELKTAFIKFGYIGDDAAFKPTVQAPAGWKLHIAVDDRNPENVARAWNVVKDILIEQRIAEAKVINPKISFASDKTQRGKQITIYQFFNPNRNWEAIINVIELRLSLACIKPASQPEPAHMADKVIEGSRFVTYRNDLSEDGRRSITAEEIIAKYRPDRRYNPFPFNRPDPFANISINHQPQLNSSSSSSSITPI